MADLNYYMGQWQDLAHFMYGRGFWYADPLREVRGLDQEALFWIPAPNALPIIWQVGHIAHRERLHIGRFLQGLEGALQPKRYEVFGAKWVPIERIREDLDSVEDVFSWVRQVRVASHAFIETLAGDDWQRVPSTSEGGLTIAHWLFITAHHTALHIGRIQLLRALLEGAKERAC